MSAPKSQRRVVTYTINHSTTPITFDDSTEIEAYAQYQMLLGNAFNMANPSRLGLSKHDEDGLERLIAQTEVHSEV